MNRCIYSILRGISAKWNGNSLIQGLNSGDRFHFPTAITVALSVSLIQVLITCGHYYQKLSCLIIIAQVYFGSLWKYFFYIQSRSRTGQPIDISNFIVYKTWNGLFLFFHVQANRLLFRVNVHDIVYPCDSFFLSFFILVISAVHVHRECWKGFGVECLEFKWREKVNAFLL